MKNSSMHQILLLLATAILFHSCRQSYVPKPSSYFRIDFPEKEYRTYDSIYPLTFEYPVYGTLAPDASPNARPGWFNISFPEYRGNIHLTYLKINGDFDRFIEENWNMIYGKIAQRADAVKPTEYTDHEHRVFSTIYDISGNAASAVQFWVTDSARHCVRGSLYFSVRPNHDSLAPSIAFFREDIIHLIESIRWKNEKTQRKNEHN